MTTQTDDDIKGLTVDEIAEKRGVTKRHAYSLYTRVNRPPEVEVPDNQKTAILSVLSASDAGTVPELQEKVRVLADTYLDAHSLTHVLWSMQKQRLIRFRERKNNGTSSALTAIKITPAGRALNQTLLNEFNASAEIVPEPVVEEPAIEPKRYPHLEALRDHARVVATVRQAAGLLESVHVEDEVVIDLLDRYSLTPAEEEMVELLSTLEASDAGR